MSGSLRTRPGSRRMRRTRRCSMRTNRVWLAVLFLTALTRPAVADDSARTGDKRYLYVVAPGIRNDLAVGGAGILVFDRDRDFALVKRIETPASKQEKPENVKG